MTIEYHMVDLFGGAITTSLPMTFVDVSGIRQVPDNQEVYLDSQGFTSIIVDILERVEKPDAEASQVHLNDIAESDEEDPTGLRVWSKGDAVFPKLPQSTPAHTLLATSSPGRRQRGRANEPDFVVVLLCLIRLEQQKTDIVVTINVPHVPNQYDKDEFDLENGKQGKLLDKAMEYRQKILETFEITDWNLFVQE